MNSVYLVSKNKIKKNLYQETSYFLVISSKILLQNLNLHMKSSYLDCSHYASCLDYLGSLKANLLLDIHLHDHVETLYDQIRSKALIQYTHPFVSVDLHMMANAFKTSVAGLEKELEALITDNQIQVFFGHLTPLSLLSLSVYVTCNLACLR